MSRCKHLVWIALVASAPACVAGSGGEVELGTVEAEATWGKKPKPPKPPADAAIPDSPPPGDGGTSTGDGGSGDGGTSGGGTSGFIDACSLPGMTRATFNATGSIAANDEGVTAALSLPFPFTLYGTAQTKFWITTNGQLGFGATPGGSAFGQATCPLPDQRFTSPIVLVYSADLVARLDPNAGVCYATTGTAPNRKLVVTWKDFFFYDCWLTSNVTFSATLNEGTNVIDVAIDRVDATYMPAVVGGGIAALGKQSGGTGYAFSCYQNNAPAGTVIHYSP
jgi:hypothetical protein